MLSLDQALDLARNAMERDRADPMSEPIIKEEFASEYPFGWLIAWTTQAAIEGRWDLVPIGAGPVLVDRHSGQVTVLASGLSGEQYASNYMETGDPYMWKGSEVEITGCSEEFDRMAILKALRSTGVVTIGDAVSIVDRALAGKCPRIETGRRSKARQLVDSLASAGMTAKQLPSRANYYGLD